MDPHSPNKLIATKYCFLILGDDTSFFFFISLFFVVFVVVIFCHYLFLQKLFYYDYFFFFLKVILFFHVPEYSGMFHVPGFIDAQVKGVGLVSFFTKRSFI